MATEQLTRPVYAHPESFDGFDINAAFQDVLFGTMSDAELELAEKVRRMEVIITEGKSEAYAAFVDFQAMALQIQSFCQHDHALSDASLTSQALRGILDGPEAAAGHDHDHAHDSDDELDVLTGKKKKKRSADKEPPRRGWFSMLLQAAR